MPVDLVDFDSQVDFYNLLQRVGELRKIGQFYTGKISLEISKIDTLVDKSSLLLEKCKFSEPDFFDLNAIGSILHSFYNGLESIFKLIHKANGGKPLTNTMWHSELFYSMFEETKSRNAVL